MPDLPDIFTREHPDLAHEAWRQALLQVLGELEAEVQRINDALLLLQATADFAQSTLSTVRGSRQQFGAVNTRVEAVLTNQRTALANLDDLQRRVAALETSQETPSDPDA